MSGIAAIFQIDGGPADESAIRAMTHAMDYRGPDGMACWAHGPVALGHCTLHSTAEGREAAQPHASEDGRVQVVLDGYLANIAELRNELLGRGVALRNKSDVEIVLRAYETWGQDCPVRLQGEFAFIIWDARQGELFCARDHQGMRPLLYHFDGKRLLLGSDTVAILAALDHAPKPNLGFLAEVLKFEWYSRDETVWTGIMRLVQAHCMRATSTGLQIEQYWQLQVDRRLKYAREEDYADHYRELLAECVRTTARTDRPLAIEVSGGLDSTALFCMAAKLQQEDGLPAPSVRGYTMAGPPGTPADEIEYVHAVVEELGLPVAELPYFLPDLSWFTRDVERSCDLPSPPNGIISLNEEMAMTADGCRACMNGVGGDQWLDGSAYYYLEFARSGAIGSFLRAAGEDRRTRGWHWTARAMIHFGISPLLPSSVRKSARELKSLLVGRRPARNDLVLTPWAQEELQARRQRYRDTLPDDPQARLKLAKLADPYWSSMFDMNSRQEARNGLSQRHPMLCRPYIEFMAAIPEHLLLRRGVRKCLHREALKGILPEKVRNRTSEGSTSQVYHRLSDQIIANLRAHGSEGLAPLVSASEIEEQVSLYCNAAIDRRSIFALWPAYVISTFLEISGNLSFSRKVRL